MRIAILPDDNTIGKVAADLIEELYRAKPNAVLGLATGSSPLPIYKELIARHQAGKLSFKHGKAFMLDEYVGIPNEHPERYRNVIDTEIASHVDFPADAVNGPDGNAPDLHAACAAYDRAIKDAGGVDLQILGIGSDGHIAFNEPGESLTSRTHVGVLTEQTRRDNARFFDGDIDQVPTHCVTQGLGTIMDARRLVLVAQGKGKARAIKELVEGAVSAKWPATIMQMHPDAWVLVDEAAAAELELADYYREVWEKSR
ncbi:glucosamine-6-phosphate deaminase [Gleimia sp. 6138-11-ORH1]|uniref:glucosamine-6-phosphate deaminase n=1 Tax=Gleimia sp. 6138-11-ORH1 TaxID=2973937 RepID=UPI002167B54F|nr:glucosamine-6-phosphate deaminase [Gleimia sp. 6138-11-ORH1]MCS4485241.1 glucosamine-6-phosphate deaminase [Gleimia sp. 6138-11-ORH1]